MHYKTRAHYDVSVIDKVYLGLGDEATIYNVKHYHTWKLLLSQSVDHTLTPTSIAPLCKHAHSTYVYTTCMCMCKQS